MGCPNTKSGKYDKFEKKWSQEVHVEHMQVQNGMGPDILKKEIKSRYSCQSLSLLDEIVLANAAISLNPIRCLRGQNTFGDSFDQLWMRVLLNHTGTLFE